MADKIDKKPATWSNVSNKPKIDLGDVTIESQPTNIDLSVLVNSLDDSMEKLNEVMSETSNKTIEGLQPSIEFVGTMISKIDPVLRAAIEVMVENSEKNIKSQEKIGLLIADVANELEQVGKSIHLFQASMRATLGELTFTANVPSTAVTVSIPSFVYWLIAIPPAISALAVYLVQKFL